jgi:hypothetical protein
MSKPILVVGDSHTRAFAGNPNFTPMFAGAGKENCFVNEETCAIVQRNLFTMLEKLKWEGPIMLFYGEPDTRFYLGKGWYPWQATGRDKMLFHTFRVRKSFVRYCKLIEECRKRYSNQIIILNVTPSSRVNQNKMVDYFNSLLKKYAGRHGLLFVDINEQVYSDASRVVQKKYEADTVHLNNNIQPLVENVLIKHGLIETSGFNSSAEWNHEEMMKKFVFDEKFGCYRLP